MNSYVVSYDLIKRKDYPSLITALQSYNYWHCLGSTWIIKSDSSASQIYQNLRQHIDADDRLIVIRAMREAAWTESFSKQCQDWLHSNL